MNCTRVVSSCSDRGQRADEQRLRDAGHALEQHVAAAEQGDDEAGDGGVLPDDGLADLGADARAAPPGRCRRPARGVARRVRLSPGHGWVSMRGSVTVAASFRSVRRCRAVSSPPDVRGCRAGRRAPRGRRRRRVRCRAGSRAPPGGVGRWPGRPGWPRAPASCPGRPRGGSRGGAAPPSAGSRRHARGPRPAGTGAPGPPRSRRPGRRPAAARGTSLPSRRARHTRATSAATKSCSVTGPTQGGRRLSSERRSSAACRRPGRPRGHPRRPPVTGSSGSGTYQTSRGWDPSVRSASAALPSSAR